MEEEEVVDELDDAEAEDSTEEDDSSDSSGSDAGSDDAEPVNRWESLSDRISARLAKSDQAKEDTDDEDDDADPDDDSDQGGEESEGEGGNPGKQDAGKAEARGTGPTRYAISDGEGNAFDVDLPEGTKIVFKGDGKDVTVKSMDELVSYAQKGAAFDRISSSQGQRISELSRSVSEMESARREDEDLLIQIVTNPKVFQAVRKELAPYADPNFRAGQDARRELEKTKAQQQQAAEAEGAGAVESFWGEVDQTIDAQLGEFSFLDAGDKQDVIAEFYRGYEEAFAALVQQYGSAGAGLTRAQNEAALELNPDNLRAAMQRIEARYAAKAEKGGQRKPKQGSSVEAKKHNDRTAAKLKSRQVNRAIRGGGSAPAIGSGNRPAQPATYEARMENSFAKLRRLGGDD